jgi:transposase
MRDIDLFQLALGLVPPWMVADAKFDVDKKRLDIEIDFKVGGRFACPECGKADCPVHDTVKKTWRHLNFFQHEAFLHARVARIDCPDCGVRLVNVPWARPGSGFTLLFEAFVMTLVKDMPVAAVARLVGEHDTRLWRLVQHYVETAVARMDLSELRRIAIDETRPSAAKTTSRCSSTWTPGRSSTSPKAMMRRRLLGLRTMSTITTQMPPASRRYAST